MVLLPFPLASSLLIVSYYVSSFEPFHVLRGGSLFLSFVPSSVRSAVRHVSAYRLAGSSMRRGVLLSARHIGKQAEASRHRIDNQIALRHEHHVTVSSVMPYCPSEAL